MEEEKPSADPADDEEPSEQPLQPEEAVAAVGLTAPARPASSAPGAPLLPVFWPTAVGVPGPQVQVGSEEVSIAIWEQVLLNHRPLVAAGRDPNPASISQAATSLLDDVGISRLAASFYDLALGTRGNVRRLLLEQQLAVASSGLEKVQTELAANGGEGNTALEEYISATEAARLRELGAARLADEAFLLVVAPTGSADTRVRGEAPLGAGGIGGGSRGSR